MQLNRKKIGDFSKRRPVKAAQSTGGLRQQARKLSTMLSMSRNSSSERAQVIVVFTISLVALLILMALVLDGGLLLLRRREAQVSADAGALAGAAYICGSPPDTTTATTQARLYADTYNHATSPSVVTFPSATQIQVVSTITQSPALAGLMGFGDIDVTALAIAECLPAGSGTSLMPFVFACEPPEGELVEDYEDCVQKIASDPPVFPDDWYLVHNSDPADEDLQCIDAPNSSPGDADYVEGAWDCDFDNDGVDDIIDSANKGWISLEIGTNPGASVLSDWILNGFDGEITTHMWAGGSPGVADSVFMAVAALEDPDFPIVLIPIFNAVCNSSGDPEVECPGKWHSDPDPDDVTLTISGAQKYYHIAAFAAFQVTCVHDQGSDSCPYRNWVEIQPGGDFMTPGTPSTIEGYFVDVVDSDLGGGFGLDTGAYIIRLTR